MQPKPEHSGERGSSLLEIVIALFLLLVLMISILQMFSMAFMINLSAAARTDMTYRAQSVVEVIRYAQALEMPLPQVPLAGGTYQLPVNSGQTNWDFWGPSGMNIIEEEDGPLLVSYTITDTGSDFSVSVMAVPNNATDARRYQGSAIKGKRVEYVATIPYP